MAQPPDQSAANPSRPDRGPVLGLIGVIVTAVLGGATTIIVTIIQPDDNDPPPSAAPSATTTAAPTTTAPVPAGPPSLANVTFTAPAPDSRVTSGFTITGTVNGLPAGSKLWVLVTAATAPDSGFFSASGSPVATQNGPWKDEFNVFNRSAAGKKRYHAIHADPTCDQELLRLEVSPEKAIERLPESCRRVAQLDVEWVA